MNEETIALLRQAEGLLRRSAANDRALKNTPGILRAEVAEELALKIQVLLARGEVKAAVKITSRTAEAMSRSETFEELYDAAVYLDDLIHVHGFANSFRIWDGKRHCVFAKD